MKIKLLNMLILNVMVSCSVIAQTTYFVSNQGNDSNDGLSWATAKATIDGAMALVTSPDDDSVFVAVGTYPACIIKNSTHVYGGFLGTENHLYERQTLVFGIAADSSCSKIDAQHITNYAVKINNYFYYNGSYNCQKNTFDGFYVTGGNQYGVYDEANSIHNISNCTMTDNACGLYLGMSYSNSYYQATFKVSDCRIFGNTSNGGINMYSGSQTYGGTYEITHCVITENTGSKVGGINFNAAYTTPYNNIIVNNCEITKNFASGLAAKAGGILTQSSDFVYNQSRSEWRVINSRIIDNTVYTTATSPSPNADNRPYIAGGISVFTHSTHILGCIIANNTAISTEGIDVTGGVVTYDNGTTSSSISGYPVGRLYMTNCVTANNLAQTINENGTGGVRTTRAATVKNTVLYNNKAGNNYQQIRYNTNTTYPYSYCAANYISNDDAFQSDSTNIVLDSVNAPFFVAPSTTIGATAIAADFSNINADWHVLPNSPLIDAGDPNTPFVTYLPDMDMDGNPRIENNVADIGAYEYNNTTFNQSITWNQELETNVSDGTLVLNATATSGLPVTYTISDENIATVSGNILTLHNAGYAIITASQLGNATWNPAADVSKILTVVGDVPDLQAQSILWEQDLTFPLSDAPIVLAAAATSGLPVQFSISDENIASINGSILTLHNVGLAIVTASQSGSDIYQPAQNVMKILNVTDPVGIIDNSPSNTQIYPNPAQNQLQISSTKDIKVVEIINPKGECLNYEIVEKDNTTLQVHSLENGLYLLKITYYDGTSELKKFVIAR